MAVADVTTLVHWSCNINDCTAIICSGNPASVRQLAVQHALESRDHMEVVRALASRSGESAGEHADRLYGWFSYDTHVRVT